MPSQKIVTEQEVITYLQTVQAASLSDMCRDFAVNNGWKGTGYSEKFINSIRPYVNRNMLMTTLSQLVGEGTVVLGSSTKAYKLFGSHFQGNTKYAYWLPETEARALVVYADKERERRAAMVRAEAERLVLGKYHREVEATYLELLAKEKFEV